MSSNTTIGKLIVKAAMFTVAVTALALTAVSASTGFPALVASVGIGLFALESGIDLISSFSKYREDRAQTSTDLSSPSKEFSDQKRPQKENTISAFDLSPSPSPKTAKQTAHHR